MQKLTTFLMFSGEHFGQAKAAIDTYISIFENSEIIEIEYYRENDPEGKAGTIKQAIFKISGQEFMAHDSLMEHSFNFTPSISIFVNVDQESELDFIYNKLSKDGFEMMPLGNYGFSSKFGWVQDKFGLSWQLNLK